MHAARVERSDRLKRVLELLRSRGAKGATTREVIEAAHVCAVNSIVSELRENGIEVECKYHGETPEGGRVYRYKIVERGQGELWFRVSSDGTGYSGDGVPPDGMHPFGTHTEAGDSGVGK